MARPLRDLRSYKELSEPQLLKRMMALPTIPPIWKTLRKAQMVMFLLAVKMKRLMIIADTGTGKTLVSIAVARYFDKLYKDTYPRRILVLCPTKLNLREWSKEIEKHSPGLAFVVLRGSKEEKWELLEKNDVLIYLETYAGLAQMVCDLKPHGRKQKIKLVPKPALVKRLAEYVNGLIMDESTHCANKATLAYRICRQISKRASLVLGLTATPFGRDPTMLWAQFYLVDFGETLGPNLGMFRAAFFNSKVNYWGGFDHKFDRKKEGLLHRFLANRSIRYEADEADLPRVMPIIKSVELTSDAEDYIDRAMDAIKQSRGSFVDIKRSFIRVRQISSGFVGYKDDDKKAEFFFNENPKLEALLDTIDSISNYKIVVFHEFIPSAGMIAKGLRELKRGFAMVNGGVKDVEAEMDRFADDADCQVMVMQNSFSFGPNMQMAKYCMFYESPVSPIVRKQAVRRVERQFSEHETIFLYDFVTEGTFDRRILEMLAEGRSLFDALVEGRKRASLHQNSPRPAKGRKSAP